MILSFLKGISNLEVKNITFQKLPSWNHLDFENINDELCISISIQLPEEEKLQLKNSTSYIQFLGWSYFLSEKNNLQLIYSSTKPCPNLSEAERYSLKTSNSTNFFVKTPQNKDEVYLRVKSFKYPCSLYLVAGIEKDYVDLGDLSGQNSESYSYYSTENEINYFKIPSSLNLRYAENSKHVVTITINKLDSDNINLYLVKETKQKIEVDSIKTPTAIIFTFIEEDFMIKYTHTYFYALEIQSSVDQFISFSIRCSEYNTNKLESKKNIDNIWKIDDF